MYLFNYNIDNFLYCLNSIMKVLSFNQRLYHLHSIYILRINRSLNIKESIK